MKNTFNLEEEIIKLYTRSTFGKVLKSEIDALVFHDFLLKHLKNQFKQDGSVEYFKLDKSEIYRMSLTMGITETRFKSALENDYFVFRDKDQEKFSLLDLVNSNNFHKDDLIKGEMKLLVPNIIVKKYLEERAAFYGCHIEYGRNRELIILDVYDFLKIVEYIEEDGKGDIINFNILNKAKNPVKHPNALQFMKDLNSVPVEERLKKIAVGLGKKVLGTAGDELLDWLFETIETGNSTSNQTP